MKRESGQCLLEAERLQKRSAENERDGVEYTKAVGGLFQRREPQMWKPGCGNDPGSLKNKRNDWDNQGGHGAREVTGPGHVKVRT